jgi:hypothetical protein
MRVTYIAAGGLSDDRRLVANSAVFLRIDFRGSRCLFGELATKRYAVWLSDNVKTACALPYPSSFNATDNERARVSKACFTASITPYRIVHVL